MASYIINSEYELGECVFPIYSNSPHVVVSVNLAIGNVITYSIKGEDGVAEVYAQEISKDMTVFFDPDDDGDDEDDY